jgi:PDZ domain
MRAPVNWFVGAWLCLPALCVSAAFAGPPPARGPQPGTVELPAPKTTKVHILLIFDTNATEMQDVLALNEKHLVALIQDRLDPEAVDLKLMKSNDVTADLILRYYSDLSVADSESVFCYYTGHGGYDETQGLFFHLTTKGTQDLSRSKLLDAMQAKHGRLTALITDCCANKAPIRELKMFADKEVMTSAGDLKKPSYVIKALLLRTTGLVDINACEKTTKAFAISGKDPTTDAAVTIGGIFTSELTALWDEELPSSTDVKNTTWPAFFNRLKQGTQGDYRRLLKNDPSTATIPDIKNQDQQTPEAVHLNARQDPLGPVAGPPIPPLGWRFGMRVFNNNGDGVRVGEVFDGSPAKKAGFESGDVLIKLNDTTLQSEDDFKTAIDGSNGRITIVFRDKRSQRVMTWPDFALTPITK